MKKITGKELVNPDPTEWQTFAIKTLWLAPSPIVPLAETLGDAIQVYLDYEIDPQNADGSWSPTRSWGNLYLDSWPIAEREWKGVNTLAMLRSLRDFGCIESYPTSEEDLNFKYYLD